MTMNDPLASALSKILNAEKVSKKEVLIATSSKLIKEVLKILHDEGYIGEVVETERSNGNLLNIALLGNINKCGAIKPRYAMKLDEYKKFESRYLPAEGMGILILTTSKGIIDHEEAKKKKLGGRLLAFCY